ncbi:MAG: hypothetical protein Q7K28_00100, partial [Candidatus Wildermuthbacteria bacterium]|nr:hypothetical protein [Candidatus Wildermuthbacteria bacterium]
MLVVLFLLATPLSSRAQEIQVLNQEIRPGDVILIRIPVEYVVQEARVHLFDRAFKPNKKGLVFVGVDLRTEPGVHSFYVIRNAIRQVDYGYQLTVLSKKIPTRKTRGSGVDSARRRRETAQIASAYAKGNSDEFFVNEALANPLSDITETSPFAISHSGIDLRAAPGTNVTAVGDGVVIMVARNFS